MSVPPNSFRPADPRQWPLSPESTDCRNQLILSLVIQSVRFLFYDRELHLPVEPGPGMSPTKKSKMPFVIMCEKSVSIPRIPLIPISILSESWSMMWIILIIFTLDCSVQNQVWVVTVPSIPIKTLAAPTYDLKFYWQPVESRLVCWTACLVL